MTEDDAKRLAHIRMEIEKWRALKPESASWDTPFLVRIIDELLSGQKEKTLSF